MFHSPFLKKFIEGMRLVLRAAITFQLVRSTVSNKYISKVCSQEIGSWWIVGVVYMHESTESVHDDKIITSVELEKI